MSFLKKVILPFLFVAIIQAQVSVEQKINELLEKPENKKFIQNAQVGISALDIKTGDKIVDVNSQFSLTPASGIKLLTTAAALHYLGADYKFRTEVYYSGKISRKVLYGNLIIRSGYDPTFASSLIEGNPGLEKVADSIYQILKKSGIKKIRGRIIVDPGEYNTRAVPDMWYWEDLGVYYGAPFNGFAVNDNLYELYLSAPDKTGEKPAILKTIPRMKRLKFKNMLLTTDSGDNAELFGAPGSYNVEIFGTVAQGKKDIKMKGAIPNPAKFFSEYLRDYLKSKKLSSWRRTIVMEKSADYKACKMLTVFESPELASIIKMTNIKSYNLYAEALLRFLAVKINNKPGTESGVDVLKKYLTEIGISPEGFNQYDGCGLSRSNSITTDIITKMLLALTKQKYFTHYYNSLAVAGDGNPLNSFGNFGVGTVLANNARLKSGYIRGVRSFSGYLKNQSGRQLAVSVIVNNFSCPVKEINNLIKDILTGIAEN